jgi:hypothetical protein
MNPKQKKAAIGFVSGIVGLVALQSFVGKEAKTLGVPHVAVGVLVAVLAHDS